MERTKQNVGQMAREDLLGTSKKQRTGNFDIAFITGFSRQYKQLEHIITKHWHLLLGDQELCKVLSRKPQFVYTKPPTLRHKLARNVINPPRRMVTFLDQVGFYSCGRCLNLIPEEQDKILRNVFHLFHVILHVTYLLSCPCGLQDVGRTTRKLKIRLREHINKIKKGFRHHSLSNHFRIYHNRDPSLLGFSGID